MNFSDIKGHVNVKRALEIALAGNHYILIFGSCGQGATLLLRSVLEMDINVQTYDNAVVIPRENLNDKGATIITIKYCPCGNYRSETRECICSIMEIKDHLRHLDHTNIEIYTEMTELVFEELLDIRQAESSEIIMSRIKQAKSIRDNVNQDLDEGSLLIFKAAYANLFMTPKMYYSILAVSKTIAALSNSSNIRPVHLAEAISYRKRV